VNGLRTGSLGPEQIAEALSPRIALSTVDHPTFSSYPLKVLAPIAAVCDLLALGAMRLLRNEPDPPRGAPVTETPGTPVAVST